LRRTWTLTVPSKHNDFHVFPTDSKQNSLLSTSFPITRSKSSLSIWRCETNDVAKASLNEPTSNWCSYDGPNHHVSWGSQTSKQNPYFCAGNRERSREWLRTSFAEFHFQSICLSVRH
jgi:hypothetical protein